MTVTKNIQSVVSKNMSKSVIQIKKGYKQTEIGLIPEDWEIRILKDVGEVKMCRRIFSNQTKEKGDVPFYKIGTFGKKPDAFITRKLYNDYRSKFPFPKIGDILISASGTIGRALVYKGRDAYFQDSNIIWIDNNNELVYNDYLKYIYEVLKYRTEGGTIQRLYNNIIYETSIICPPKPEQKAIAEVLSDTDNLIQAIEQKLNKKRAIKQGAMQKLLAPKEDWEVKKLGEICDVLDNLRVPLNSKQRLKMKGDIPYCGANGIVDYVNDYIIDDEIILIAEDGGYFDEYKTRPIAYLMKGKCWVNNHAHILKAKTNYFQEFIFYSVVHKNILDYINGGTRVKLNKSDLVSIEINVPSSKEQQTEITTILSDMDAEIEQLEQKLSKYKLIKQGLMQNLLTGKIRLV